MPISLDDCDSIFSMVRSELRRDELQRLFGRLLDDYRVVSVDLGRGAIFWRARPCAENGYARIADVTYPPLEAAKVGRFSEERQPRFYAAARLHTALAEQHTCCPGDFFHVVGIQVLKDTHIRVLILGEQHHVFRTGYLRALGADPGNALSRMLNERELSDAMATIYIDAFFGSILSDPHAADHQYIRCHALLAEVVKRWEIDAVFYPSVKDPWGTNLVITPAAVDHRMHFAASWVIRIDRCRDFGLFENTTVRRASGIWDDGTFQWQEGVAAGTETLFNLTREESEFLASRPGTRSGLLDLVAFRTGEGR